MPRVLHVDTSLELRGGQRQLAYLLAGRPDDAWAGVPDSPLAALIGPPAIALRPGNDPRNALRLRLGLRHAPCDVVAAHTPHAHGAALLCGRPLAVHRRVDFPPRHPWKYRTAAAVIAVSRAVAEVLARAGVTRVRVVHDGVDALPVAPFEVRWPRPLYGAVGALVAHKGHAHLLDAMVEVPGTLIVAGEGALRPALEARIAARGLAGRVILLGNVDNVGGLLAAIDVFVHPSVEEGLGQAVIEAMAAGCRVVATRAGGIPEVVGDAGRLVPARDPTALADAMRAALATDRGRGVEAAGAFSVARMVRETGEIYREIHRGISTRA